MVEITGRSTILYYPGLTVVALIDRRGEKKKLDIVK